MSPVQSGGRWVAPVQRWCLESGTGGGVGNPPGGRVDCAVPRTGSVTFTPLHPSGSHALRAETRRGREAQYQTTAVAKSTEAARKSGHRRAGLVPKSSSFVFTRPCCLWLV
ncbi:hypothetical protein GGTG_00573 [Gaeumannomyces tritici R3-111a-1]|uniref:Uncharacterized protein n=1 Tax=Gaeumannomyces tritici (strain R3-111a-1) TaxID=644352 RepID=J3NH35_GAET3|nr:hypothetical protein GGTG_00573 [Gaeumannomyces tritici R3-111a-1]EJT80578.1 hypothetical protein GGTG_00573 [Gaeumannomyces tritici R3-111a-1]